MRGQRTTLPIAALVLLALLPGGAARAQMPLRGMAYAAIDSVERGQLHCFGDTLEKARACVLEKCRSMPGSAASCQITSACDRSGWAGFISVRMKTGVFTMSMCGVPSRVSLIMRFKDMCRSYRSRGLDACALDTVWTPGGDAEATRLVWTPRTLGRAGSAFR